MSKMIKQAHRSHTRSSSFSSHQSLRALRVEHCVHAWSGSGSPPCVQGCVMSHMLQEGRLLADSASEPLPAMHHCSF